MTSSDLVMLKRQIACWLVLLSVDKVCIVIVEQKESEKELMAKSGEQQSKKKAAKALKPSSENSKNKKKKEQEETISEAQECNGESNAEDAFWMPPVGQRWDNDNGGDRWASGSDSEHESDKIIAMGMLSILQTSRYVYFYLFI